MVGVIGRLRVIIESGVRDYDDFLMVLGIRFLRFASRGRTTSADPNNLPRFLWPWISRSEPSARGRYRRTTVNPFVGEELKMALNRHRQLIECRFAPEAVIR
jgi:hypothetical protein